MTGSTSFDSDASTVPHQSRPMDVSEALVELTCAVSDAHGSDDGFEAFIRAVTLRFCK